MEEGRERRKKGDRIDGEKDVEGEQVRENKGELERGGYWESKEDRGVGEVKGCSG